jgi:surface protein
MHRKYLSLSLSCLMATSTVAPAFAADVTGSSDVTLTVEAEEQPEVIQVRVPGEIPLNMDTEGNVTTADNLKVENLSTNLDVEVTGITVTSKDGWTIKDFSEDLASKEAGTKELAMQFRGDGTQDGGSVPVTDGNWDIDHQSDLLLNVVAKMPKQGQEYVSTKTIAQVDYAVAIRDGEAPTAEATSVVSKDKMRSVLQNLTGSIVFSKEKYDAEKYPGTATDISEAGDGSVMAVVNGQDAVVYADGGCLAPEDCNYMFGASSGSASPGTNEFKAQSLDLRGLDTRNVTNMNNMFSCCSFLKTLNISGFDTSKVTTMHGTFYDCSSLTTLDVSSFDTSNVIDMAYMFSGCSSLASLDLSGFDTSNVGQMSWMFMSCRALTTCYGRTQADCNKFNGSPYKASNVNFIVKPEA